ncbi:hypothetical protein MLD38_027080 [Melastoma candidum]|uniref:Uncharacterized protein n=1 Tax=Melastoma candidum TaxID=119954 RepID=A0ACB9P1Y7_9MYRT|nr:hypothetical protein MLD38_027080 [Melastoma candidum]
MADHASQPVVKRSDASLCCELSKINRVHLLNLAGTPDSRLFYDEQHKLLTFIWAMILVRFPSFASQIHNINQGDGCGVFGRVNKRKVLTLLSKLLAFCIPTMAVIRGHAVGTGCVFALAHDYRIMKSDNAYIFMNEVNLGMSLLPGVADVLRAKLPPLTFQKVLLTGCMLNSICSAFCFHQNTSLELSSI